MAEKEGVEPTNPLKDQTVFKTVLLANAVTSPLFMGFILAENPYTCYFMYVLR